MNFDVYCDEVHPDVLTTKKSQVPNMLIGSLWLPSEKRQGYKDAIHSLRSKHKIGREFKWNQISPSREEFYLELLDWFQSQGDNLRFRCIVVSKEKLDMRLHEYDSELGFYKFYYQLLHHWIYDNNEYSFFLDCKTNRKRDRLNDLRLCLDRANLSSLVTRVQSTYSRESVLIQLADVLTGLASYRLNNTIRVGSTKERVLTHYEGLQGRKIAPTHKIEQKFNVFQIQLQGGW